MEFISIASSDRGIKKTTNQDAALVKEALFKNQDEMMLAVMCDGMGGLQKGEVASSSLVHAFSDWFEKYLPMLCSVGINETVIYNSWSGLVNNMNLKIREYGKEKQIKLGTTLVALLVYNDKYFYMTVGDSRLYLIDKDITQISHDQSLVQSEIDRGMLTEEQAHDDPRRSILLQCVGVNEQITPEFGFGDCKANTIFVLCSDGFVHEISAAEMLEAFLPKKMTNEYEMKRVSQQMIETLKERNEKDNITIIMSKLLKSSRG